MRNLLGYILYLVAVAITVLVVAVKYFQFGGAPGVTSVVMRDPAASLLVALVLSFISKWV